MPPWPEEEEDHTRLLLVEYEALTTDGPLARPGKRPWPTRPMWTSRSFTFPDDEPEQTRAFPGPTGSARTRRPPGDDLAALAFGIRMEQQAIDSVWAGSQTRPWIRALEKPIGSWSKKRPGTMSRLKDQWEKLAGMPFAGALTRADAVEETERSNL